MITLDQFVAGTNLWVLTGMVAPGILLLFFVAGVALDMHLGSPIAGCLEVRKERHRRQRITRFLEQDRLL